MASYKVKQCPPEVGLWGLLAQWMGTTVYPIDRYWRSRPTINFSKLFRYHTYPTASGLKTVIPFHLVSTPEVITNPQQG